MEKSIDLFEYTAKHLDLMGKDITTFSPLTLAFLGDAVYEVIIRTMVVCEGNTQVNKLHKKSSNLVKAEAQANMIKSLMDELSEEELAYYKRGRNAKSYTSAKNATIADYRMATGFEALVGYLYLTRQSERMMELIKKGIAAVEEMRK
ncbi:MAG: ribonuclease III [Clostridiales bacterium]|nr:ribonuclease III [Clostridiales bacterium]